MFEVQLIDGISLNDLRQVGERIAITIDFQQSKEARRICVLPNVDAQLDELKRNYDGLESFLNEVAAHLVMEIPEWARPYVKNCIFYPQIGFLTVVSLDPGTGRGKYEGEGCDGDAWESMFVTDGDIYYKNHRMRELDTQYGDLYCMIVGRRDRLTINHDSHRQMLTQLQTRRLKLCTNWASRSWNMSRP